MYEYDDVPNVADSRGKLIKSLEESIELFEYLQTIVNTNLELEKRFKDSINSIAKSVKIVKEMDKKDFTVLIDSMYDNNHNSKF